MNTVQDIKRITDEYYHATGVQMRAVSSDKDVMQAAMDAENRFAEGLAQLNRLKLAPVDRKHFKLLREAFTDVIHSMRYIRKGNASKAKRYGKSSADKATRYADLVGGNNE